MHFSNIFEDDVDYNILECTKLDNNILMYRFKIDENCSNIIKLKDKQYAILIKNGNILDAINEEGVYTLIDGKCEIQKDFEDYIIKEDFDGMFVIFFNMDIIENNKFYISKNIKKNFFGDGNFEFILENPIKLFNKIIKVRNYYSREELLEQIREKISKVMSVVIKENEEEYILDEEYIDTNINIFKEYGIKIVSCDMKNIFFKKK